MDHSSLPPDTTSSLESDTPATIEEYLAEILGSSSDTDAEKIDVVDPLDTIYIAFKNGVQELPRPQIANDLYEFELAITEMLNSNPRTVPLLSPLGDDPGLCRLSTLFYSVIRAHVPRTLVETRHNLDADTYKLLQSIRRSIPKIYHHSQYKSAPPPYIFPTRRKTETMVEYANRFWVWKNRYLRSEDPPVVYYLATCIWVNHSQLYDVAILAKDFSAVAETFKNTEEVIAWFKQQDSLGMPVVSPDHNASQGSRQGQTGNPKRQGSARRNQHPVPANESSSTQKRTNANVNKNGNNYFKNSGKKWRKKKNQTSQAVSTDAGDNFEDMLQ